MKNRKTYAEIMRLRNNQRKKSVKLTMLDIYIQMVIDESLFIRKKELLEVKVNSAIDSGNKQLFMEVSSEYKKHMRYSC
ncbi:IDEAL domain-containing protein [Ferdinandcohnia quinoae]|uniref:IDEAL domain-containing protein n=1 Tax=Fredinandcohnia quinoae TaxID=2918902 RepID=A0AAW5ECF8_9BACI|nr:IDEAL domain-containing protein [Fredinandcohnia sp. SECRCQ15]MCH1626853.1 IDEAL domain-containing protein [Fredinandcohnia sp. SECRCQ15]